MKELFVILVSFINLDKDTDILKYNPKTSWDNYETVKKEKSYALAETTSGIGYYWNGDKTIDVNFVFNTSKSWVLETAKTKETLNHEQRHLDITYLYALKLVKELRDCQPQSDREAQKIYWRVDKELWEVQNDYDLESNNKQPQWDKKIDSLISLYKTYSLPDKKK
jgi:hypothetical protein